MDQIMQSIEKKFLADRDVSFAPGDTVAVSFRIREEGDKERIQNFQGVVIQKNGSGMGATFTLRRSSGNNVYVERVFPLNSPLISGMKVARRGKVRRAKLFYLRGRTGKATRIKEKK